jgi:DNA polymerase-3 subunit gamma/tau
MGRKALYRKYRSASLDEIVGQDHVVDVLRANLKNNKHAHAYLLTGPRGVGKTSVARILAYALNDLPYGGDHLDIIEIDAASNGSVDDARDLRDKASIRPSALKYKVYIIDEVHMLSRQAFDALLKLVEEPPDHAIFILATTEVDKVPATIKSRAEQYHFHLVPRDTIAEHLDKISQAEKIEAEADALALLAELGQGSLRDAISLLDQMSSDKITKQIVERTFGLPPEQQLDAIITAAADGNVAELVSALDELKQNGVNSVSLTQALIRKIRTLSATTHRFFDLMERLLDVPKSADPDLKLLAVLGNWSAPAISSTNLQKSALTEIKEPVVTEKKMPPKSEHTENSQPEKPVKKAPKEPPATKPAEPKKPQKSHPDRKIVWTDLVREIKKSNPMFGNSLQRARHEFDGETLTLHFASQVSQKAANTPKHRKILADAVKDGYGFKPKIEVSDTVDKSAPLQVQPSTSKYTAISDIMGGGEIV